MFVKTTPQKRFFSKKLQNFRKKVWKLYFLSYLCNPKQQTGYKNAEVAQLVEHNLAKVGVASSSLVFCSKKQVSSNADFRFEKYHPTGFNHMSVVLVHKAAFLFLYTLILAKYLLLQSIWIEQR